MSWYADRPLSSEPPPDDRPWRILIADDQPFDRAEAKAALLRGSARRYTFTEVDTAAGVFDALADAAEAATPFDCLLLDFRLPDGEAPEVLAQLPRAERAPDLPAVPVVVVTGADRGPEGASWNRSVLRAGAQDFVGKDWLTPASLTRAVEGAIERHAMTRSLGEREQALRDSRARLQFTLEGGEMGTWEWDLATDEVYYDARMETLWEIDDDAVRYARQLFDLIHPDDLPEVWEAVERAKGSKSGRYEAEFRIILGGGRVRWIVGRGVLLRTPEGETHTLYGLNFDATERYEQEAALQQKNAEMERFAYTVSHDLKSPLVTITGFVGLLKGHVEAGRTEKAVAAADRVLGAAERMSRLIEDLLTLSRAGRSGADPEPVDLDALAARLASEFEPRATAAGGTVEVEGPLGAVLAGAQGVAEALENLLANAVRYALQRGGSRVAIRSEGTATGGLRLLVEDDGPGVPEAYRERIFQLFQRLDTDRQGTGVGLAVVARVMEVAGGRASVESAGGRGDRPGARFVLTFPPEAVLPLRKEVSPPSSG